MAKNPYEQGTPERNEFESFRQGVTELRAHGAWPANRMTFHRSEISVEFVEVEEMWTQKLEIEEAAVYTGKDHIIGEHNVDVLTPDIEKPTVTFTRELGYLTQKQANDVLKMFDSKEAYAKNFTALKTITSGFFDLLQDGGLSKNEKVGKMFNTVNNLQSALLPDNYMEMESILLKNKLLVGRNTTCCQLKPNALIGKNALSSI
jgi:hypothetical protein